MTDAPSHDLGDDDDLDAYEQFAEGQWCDIFKESSHSRQPAKVAVSKESNLPLTHTLSDTHHKA